MKKNAIFTTIILALFFVTADLFPQQKGDKKEVLGSTIKIIKEVKYIPAGTNKEILQKQPGKALYAEDKVETGKNSISLVKFLDGTILTVQENSLLRIFGKVNKQANAKGIKANTVVDHGSAYFKVEKQKSNSEFKFTTPTMVASIRGTEGYIKVDNDTVSSLALVEGTVTIESVGGKKETGTVTAGKFATVNSNGEFHLYEEIPPDLKKEMKSAQTTDIKKLRISTDNGDIIIKYK